MKIKHRYKVNGKIYENFEDIPEEFRKLIDQNNNGKSDFVEEFEKDPSKRKWRVRINKNEHSEATHVKDNKKLIIGLLILAVGGLLIWLSLNL